MRSSEPGSCPPAIRRRRRWSSTSSTPPTRSPSGVAPGARSSRRSTSCPRSPTDVLQTNYPLLVRALANIVLCYVPGRGVWFTTMERGHYGVESRNGEAALAEGVVERLTPLATSRLVIDNEFRTDLEAELWDGDEVVEEIKWAGRRMGDLDLLPAPFPIEDLLDERDIRQVKRLYGIGGLSYGNLSMRKDEKRFWMSASGVDKSKLEIAGRDVLLVAGYDEGASKMLLSVPPGVEPRRVSVDAIEHWMIYQAHPGVGGIVHVHAWMEGIQRDRHQLPVRDARARPGGRRPARARARPRARRHRSSQPRHHGHRRQPPGDPRPDRAEHSPPGADDVTRLSRPRGRLPQPADVTARARGRRPAKSRPRCSYVRRSPCRSSTSRIAAES